MWNYAKDVDRARYGGEGKNSQRFVSYEHIPLPVGEDGQVGERGKMTNLH